MSKFKDKIYNLICNNKQKGIKQFAVLIDPDNIDIKNFKKLIDKAQNSNVDYFFVGGSLVVNNNLSECIDYIKNSCSIPVVLFPGNILQLNDKADGILFLSLISGRNPEMLIGKHVTVAPLLKKSSLEVIPTGYILVDGGKPTSVTYISNTTPIPYEKNDIAVATSIAGEMLGLKLIYMDSGSGAKFPVSSSMIKAVSQNVNIPIIVGGGIKTPENAISSLAAGADIIVVGNAIENDISVLENISLAVHSFVLEKC